MPVITLNDQQYTLRPGANRLGGSADADLRVAEDPSLGIQAIVDYATGTNAVIRRASDKASVRVNGVPLVDPTPLMHGDKVEIAGRELVFGDDAKGGATQFVTADAVVAMAQKRAGAARATTGTGGRLVSLVDGKEYAIPVSGVVIGRDPTADVVVPQNEVSRKHAEIVPAQNGYVLRDLSANGVYVNGTRVEQSLVLSRADVIRVGSEEFRFYADIAQPGGRASVSAAPAPPPPQAPAAPRTSGMSIDGFTLVEPMAPTPTTSPAVPSPPPAAPSPAAPPPAAAAESSPAPATTAPAAPKRDPRPVLAMLEIVNEGPRKGTMFEVRDRLAHIGRGSHNDVVIADDSVSDTHAKLQRRDAGWFVVDLGSTNGTYVDGKRIAGEQALEAGGTLRVGAVKLRFLPADLDASAAKGTRMIGAVARPAAAGAAASPATLKAAAGAPTAEAEKQGGVPVWVWIAAVVAVAGAATYFLLTR